MFKNSFVKLLLVFTMIFVFSSAVSAYVWNINDWEIHDDEAAKEDARQLLERQEAAKSAEGVYGPFANIPTIPFGGNQNITEQTWPAAMRKAMALHMPQDVKDWFKTPAFDYSPGKHNTNEDLPGNVGYITTQQEILDWFAALPTSRMQYQLITGFPYYTGNGFGDYALARTFEVVLAVFSKPSVFTPEEVKALGKPVVWFHASIHGGETGPGEALLQVAKEFAEGKHDDILDKVTVVIVPRFNVDGAWNIQRTTTAGAPFGHGGAGSAGIDMNRDFVAYETPLVRAIRQLTIAYDPIATVCGHQQGYTFDQEYAPNAAGTMVTNGWRRGYEAKMTTVQTHNLNVDKRVRDLGFYLFQPAMKKSLEDNKVGWNRYIGGSISAAMGYGTFPTATVSADVVSSDGVTGPLAGQLRYTMGNTDFALVPEEGIGINGIGLGNQSIVFVTEVASVGVRLDYLRRSYACYLAYMAVARTAAENVGLIMDSVTASRNAEIARWEPLSFWGKPRMPEDIDRNVIEFKGWKKDDTPEVVNSIGMGTRPIKWIQAHHADRDPVAQVTRPIAYIIHKDYEEAALRLFYAGVKLERLTSDQTFSVEAYTVLTTGANNLSASGSTSQVGQAIRSVSKATVTKTFPKDSFVVRMDQVGASLAGLAIEPMAIRNFGNMYLSRTPTTVIPIWYRKTFFPVAVGQEYPCYRYVTSTNNAITTYPANMNLPLMLTMVEKVHAYTQEEIAGIKSKLALTSNPEYVSKFELPVLSSDNYRNMANVSLNEAFMLPNGEIIKINADNVTEVTAQEEVSSDLTRQKVKRFVEVVAPKGLDGSVVYLAKNDGTYEKVYQKELKPVSPDLVLAGGKAPAGADINGLYLVWAVPFDGEGVVLADNMLNGYKIAHVVSAADGAGYTLKLEGDKVIAVFNSKNIVNGAAEVYLSKTGAAASPDDYDAIILVRFSGSATSKSSGSGCSATGYSIFGLIALIAFMSVKRK